MASNRTITGTAMRNAAPHQNQSNSAPPTSGPSATPPDSDAAQMPIAVPRWCGCRNMLLSKAKVDGISVAPATPSTARAAMSMPVLVEYAASTDETANTPAPSRRSLRRPIRSPSTPMGTRKPAIMNP